VLLAPVAPAIAVARLRGRGAAHALVVAALAAANPVVVYQLTTSYVDGVTASLLTALLLALRAHCSRPSRGWLQLVAACAALLAGVKLTGLVYAAIVLAVVAVATWRRCGRAIAAWGTAGLLVGVALAGDSYGKNWLAHGNPFHAAWQPGGSVLANQANADFLARGPIERVALAWAGRADADDVRALPVARWPFTQWTWRHRYDPRFSGFGPLFFDALLLLLAVCAARGLRPGPWTVAIVLSALATEAAWWARLAPQWWLLPLLPLLGAGPARKSVRWLERLLLATLVANVVLVAAPALRSARRIAAEWHHAAARTGPAPTIATYAGRAEHAAVIARRLAELRAR
jgi:hypothetical protein